MNVRRPFIPRLCFFFFFKVEIRLRTLIPLLCPDQSIVPQHTPTAAGAIAINTTINPAASASTVTAAAIAAVASATNCRCGGGVFSCNLAPARLAEYTGVFCLTMW